MTLLWMVACLLYDVLWEIRGPPAPTSVFPGKEKIVFARYRGLGAGARTAFTAVCGPIVVYIERPKYPIRVVSGEFGSS